MYHFCPTKNYEVLKSDPTSFYSQKLSQKLQGALEGKLIDRKDFEYLRQPYPRVATFYSLPKIHKGTNPLKGRPIVSGIGSLTQHAGTYIDQILRPFVLAILSYLINTTDLLKRLDSIILEPDMWLASIDVEALYTSIPHNNGLTAVKYFLYTRSNDLNEHNHFVIKLLDFVLTHNYLLFNNQFYHQLRGTAISSPCALSYANLLLGWWEDTAVFSESMTHWTRCITLWSRFIDDFLLLCSGT